MFLENSQKRGLMTDGPSRREMDVIRNICPDGVAEGRGEYIMPPDKDGKSKTVVAVIVKREIQPSESNSWRIDLTVSSYNVESGNVMDEAVFSFWASRHFTDVSIFKFNVTNNGIVAAEKKTSIDMSHKERLNERRDGVLWLTLKLAEVAYLMEEGRVR